MKNKNTLLVIILVFVLLLGGAYVLYDRLGQEVAAEQMIVHSMPMPAAEPTEEETLPKTEPEPETAEHEAIITLTAQWTPITYKVRFNANGGVGTMSNQTMTFDYLGTTTSLELNKFTKVGNHFKGWSLTQDGGIAMKMELVLLTFLQLKMLLLIYMQFGKQINILLILIKTVVQVQTCNNKPLFMVKEQN